ncbi:C4-dicarboxylate ABC transporter [Marinobacterium aestuarii]|uniref:TRAP transporter large permease protein n=1 Tax=Marinobacterium aestuarii TaxID=1821621 RepID=A0A1A9F0A5_9GAMM|nr:TRAP transporter large permease [Marinobacterium aestuarii]ANG63183.1 C4-dicarboxylate ABC transporter [Marinobacterium aestuarii]
MTALLVFSALLCVLLAGVPIFVALAGVGVAVLAIAGESVTAVGDTLFATLNRSVLATIPLFVFMAQVMVRGKVIDDLYQFAHNLIGHVKGGLGVSTVLSCTIFSSISGSSVATALSIGSSAIPQMTKFGYPTRRSLGVVAAGGTLGILIPPSGPMILYSLVTDASIGALFLAGLIPGLLMAAIFSAYCMLSARREASPDFPGFRAVWGATKKAFWAVMMPPFIMGGIYLGVFTATEAAAAGSVYALLVATLVYRSFGWSQLYDATMETMRISMMVFAIIAGAAIFGHAITLIRLPVGISEWVVASGFTPFTFILVVMGIIFVMGMFLESIAIILITTPIFLPALVALDIDLIWYGVLLMVNLELAMITPPVGMNLFVIKGITDEPLSEVIKGAYPYVLMMCLGLALLVAFPWLATALPYAAGYGL